MPRDRGREARMAAAHHEAEELVRAVEELEARGARERAIQAAQVEAPGFEYETIMSGTGRTWKVPTRPISFDKEVPDDVTGAAIEPPIVTDAALIDSYPEILNLVDQRVQAFSKRFQNYVGPSVMDNLKTSFKADLLQFFMESMVVVKKKSR